MAAAPGRGEGLSENKASTRKRSLKGQREQPTLITFLRDLNPGVPDAYVGLTVNKEPYN